MSFLISGAINPKEPEMKELKAISPQGKYCFFGYYDKCQWDEKEEYLLFHEVAFQDRLPLKEDRAKICLMEAKTGKVEIIDETCAWNFQQGAMLQWLPGQRVLYNSVRDGRFISVIRDIHTGGRKEIGRPASTVSPDGNYAVSINFARLATWRAGYGYESLPDPWAKEKWPKDDGVYSVDLNTGDYRLIISLERLRGLRSEDDVPLSFGRINHTDFAPDGKHFLFLNRWKKEAKIPGGKTRFFVSDLEGKNMNDMVDTYRISHFAWKNEREAIAWMDYRGKQGFWLVDTETNNVRFLSEKIQTLDGHCSYSKDKRYILLDTYPLEGLKTDRDGFVYPDGYRYLKIFDTAEGKDTVLGKYYSPPLISDVIRCDLHPRWGRKHDKISFDSIHEGYRRTYSVSL